MYNKYTPYLYIIIEYVVMLYMNTTDHLDLDLVNYRTKKPTKQII